MRISEAYLMELDREGRAHLAELFAAILQDWPHMMRSRAGRCTQSLKRRIR